MRTKIKYPLFCIGLLFQSSVALANPGIAFGSGQGIHKITPYRFQLAWDFGNIWSPSLFNWGLRVVLESSFARWDGPYRADLAPGRPCDLNVATLGPMFKWQRQHPYSGLKVTPYCELGVSPSWLSEKEIQGRILSLHFQFEDKAGVGIKLGAKQQYDVSLRAYHYSNASIKRPNSGVNLAMVSFGMWFPS